MFIQRRYLGTDARETLFGFFSSHSLILCVCVRECDCVRFDVRYVYIMKRIRVNEDNGGGANDNDDDDDECNNKSKKRKPVHTNYSCMVCEKECSRLYNVKKHWLRHHAPPDTSECPVAYCGQTGIDDLFKHLQDVHKNEHGRLWRCELCKYANPCLYFCRASDLWRHEEEVHGKTSCVNKDDVKESVRQRVPLFENKPLPASTKDYLFSVSSRSSLLFSPSEVDWGCCDDDDDDDLDFVKGTDFGEVVLF